MFKKGDGYGGDGKLGWKSSLVLVEATAAMVLENGGGSSGMKQSKKEREKRSKRMEKE